MQSASASMAFSSVPTSEEKASTSFDTVGTDELKREGEEIDVDIRKVPDLSAQASTGTSKRKAEGAPRKRSACPQEMEKRRMKRLLRNRVSAQQARERKKAYMSDLACRATELEEKNSELEERVSVLQRENFMLRQILKNTTTKNSSTGSGFPTNTDS